jgi:hypothetical protein
VSEITNGTEEEGGRKAIKKTFFPVKKMVAVTS